MTMKRKAFLYAAGAFLLATLLTSSVSATNTYFPEATQKSCERKFGQSLDNGRNFCQLLYSWEEATLGAGGGTVIGFDDANNLINGGTTTTVDAALEFLTTATAGNGAYDIGFDAAGGFSTATVGLALTELTDVTGGGTTGSQIIGVDATTVTIPFDTCANVEACLVELTTTSANQGANIIGYQDGGTQTAAATVDAALDQIYGAVNMVTVPISVFRECSSGDVGNLAGHGTILASDSEPSLEGIGTSYLQAITWATGNTDAICGNIMLPPNFSGASDVTINLIVGKSAAGDDVPTFGVITNWTAVGQAVASADVTDTSAAIVANALTQSLATTVTADGVPDDAVAVSLNLTPGAHDSEVVYLIGVQIVYVSE